MNARRYCERPGRDSRLGAPRSATNRRWNLQRQSNGLLRSRTDLNSPGKLTVYRNGQHIPRQTTKRGVSNLDDVLAAPRRSARPLPNRFETGSKVRVGRTRNLSGYNPSLPTPRASKIVSMDSRVEKANLDGFVQHFAKFPHENLGECRRGDAPWVSRVITDGKGKESDRLPIEVARITSYWGLDMSGRNRLASPM